MGPPVPGPVDATLGEVNQSIPVNSTEPESVLHTIMRMDFILLQMKIVLTALGIIYLAAHGALRRPPSAAPPKRKKGSKKEVDEENSTQGLTPSDAILFPLLAGTILIGLYYLIHWLQDPELLSKIMRYYMSITAVASLTILFSHALHLATSFVFPRYWRDTKGDGSLLMIEPALRSQQMCSQDGASRGRIETKKNPLPGRPSNIQFSDKVTNSLWEIRRLLSESWTVKLRIHGIIDERHGVKFNDMVAFVAAVLTCLAFQRTNSTALSNIVGQGVSYGSLMWISPTTFTTSTLLLIGLFFYDIVMVFFTCVPFLSSL
jgi:minor histocompatibility antigen H13